MSTYIKTFTQYINESAVSDPHGILAFMKTPEYAQILAKGYRLKSSPLQIKNGTLSLTTDFGYDLLFMAKTLYVRKYKHGYDRQAVIVQYNNLTPERYWSNAADLLLNKFDITTGVMSSDAKKGARAEFKDLIATYIDTFSLPQNIAALFKKYISYSNLKGNAEEIRNELKEVFFVENNKIFVKVRVQAIKIDIHKIVHLFPECDYELNLIFTTWFNARTFDGKAYVKRASNIRVLVEDARNIHITGETDTDNINMKVLDWETNISNKFNFSKFFDKSATLESPQTDELIIELVTSTNASISLTGEIGLLKVILINSKTVELKTDLDPSKILIASGGRAQTEYEFRPYSEQWDLKLRGLDGSGNDDHNADIDLHGTVNDLW